MTTVFIAASTTGPSPNRHEMWEIAAIVRGHRDPQNDGEWLWQLRTNLSAAQPDALSASGYYTRSHRALRNGSAALELASPRWGKDVAPGVPGEQRTKPAPYVSEQLAGLIADAHLVGVRPWHTERFLHQLLRTNHQCPTNRRHVIDVETLAVGYMHGLDAGYADSFDPAVIKHAEPPWNIAALSAVIGVEPTADQPTALGTARWALRTYDAVTADPAPDTTFAIGTPDAAAGAAKACVCQPDICIDGCGACDQLDPELPCLAEPDDAEAGTADGPAPG